MTYLVVRVEDGVAYIWGETFALVKSVLPVDDGWFFGSVGSSELVDKKGVARKYVNILAHIDDDIEVVRILNMYFGTVDGINDILEYYKELIPLRMRNDSRFKTFEDMYYKMGYCRSTIKEHEMLHFMDKLTSIVASRVVKDKLKTMGVVTD